MSQSSAASDEAVPAEAASRLAGDPGGSAPPAFVEQRRHQGHPGGRGRQHVGASGARHAGVSGRPPRPRRSTEEKGDEVIYLILYVG